MKAILSLLFLFSGFSFASSIPLAVEKQAAELSGCNKAAPCIVSSETTSKGYTVKVIRSVKITEDGVLKFKTGSVVYYTFSTNGKLIRTSPTT